MTNKIKIELKWYPKRLCQFKLKYASVLPEVLLLKLLIGKEDILVWNSSVLFTVYSSVLFSDSYSDNTPILFNKLNDYIEC